MKPLALAVAAGAVVALSACSHSAATPAASSGPSAAAHATVTPSVAPVSCLAQYNEWRHGPVRKVIAAIDAVGSGSSTSARTTAVKKAGHLVVKAARYPIPACADPRGYWTALLMHVNAAAGSAGSASGRPSITLALKSISTLRSELRTELKRTAGAR